MAKLRTRKQQRTARKDALRLVLWRGARNRNKVEASLVDGAEISLAEAMTPQPVPEAPAEDATPQPVLGYETPTSERDGEETPRPGPEAAPFIPKPVKVEAPATPQPVSEAAAAHWPEAGVKVAVGVESLMHSLRLSETGVCEGPAPDELSEMIVKLDNHQVLAPVRIPRNLLVPLGAPMRDLKKWDKFSDSVKRGLLLQLGVRDPRDEVLPGSACMNLTMWGEYMHVGMRVEEPKFKFVQPAFVRALEEGAELTKQAVEGDFAVTFPEPEERARRQTARHRLLQEWWGEHEVLLVCCCDDVSGCSGLLALRKTPFSARYYEAGAFGREAIKKQMSLVLSHLEDVPTEIPHRSNCATGSSEDLIAHYIEQEVREAEGETRGNLGWAPQRLKKVKGNLKGLRSCLEGARKKWCLEENVIEAKRQQVTEETVAKLLQTEERRKAFEARWNEVKARMLKALDEGTFEGPVVPIGFKPPEPRQQRESRDEDEVEKVTYLLSLEEPPEGPPIPRYQEGGSSGSDGSAAPAEVDPEAVQPPVATPPPMMPPLEPPPPADTGSEAPPPSVEVAPSKAEEVKQRLADAPERVQKKAYEALEDEFMAVAKPEDLRQVDREKYEKVRGTYRFVCGRCRWVDGCDLCDEDKAWRYACRSTLWHSADAALRPKAKPKGRPKKA